MEMETYRKELSFLVDIVEAEMTLCFASELSKNVKCHNYQTKTMYLGINQKEYIACMGSGTQNNKILSILHKSGFPNKIFYP